jgi:hypothetical protein
LKHLCIAATWSHAKKNHWFSTPVVRGGMVSAWLLPSGWLKILSQVSFQQNVRIQYSVWREISVLYSTVFAEVHAFR